MSLKIIIDSIYVWKIWKYLAMLHDKLTMYNKIKKCCHSRLWPSSHVSPNLNFVVCCEELLKHFFVEAVDHFYDDVYQVVRKTAELFKQNVGVERKTVCQQR